jgi:hypothetical protein
MMRVILRCGLLAALLLPAQALSAHEVRPGFLELRETAANVMVGEPTSMQAGGAFIEHGLVACAAPA